MKSKFPTHWQTLPFENVIADVTAGNPKLQRSEYSESGALPIIDQGQEFIGGYTNDSIFRANVNLPTIIFGDHTRIFKFVDFPFCLGADGTKILEPKINLDKKFLFHYLNSLQITSAGYSRHYKFLKENIVPIPPLEEQKRIAAILDKADAIFRKRQQAIKLADEFLRSVFLNMFGDPVTNPKGWKIKPLKKLGRSITGSTPPSNLENMWGYDVPFATPGDLGDPLSKTVRYVTKEGATKTRLCKKGSLLVCCIGATIGKSSIAEVETTFNQQINVQEWNSELNEYYGYFIFKLFPELVTKNAIKTTLPILKKSLFDEIVIPVPDLSLQSEFSKIVKATWSIQQKIKTLDVEHLFCSLSQKMFNK